MNDALELEFDVAAPVAHAFEMWTARIGMWGWSGGGTNTLNAMFRFPDVYAVGVSVAPVPDQRANGGAGQRQRDPRQPGARAHVDDQARRRAGLSDDGTVEQVTAPQPVRLPRADQAPPDAVGREQLGERLGPRQLGAEDPLGRFT